MCEPFLNNEVLRISDVLAQAAEQEQRVVLDMERKNARVEPQGPGADVEAHPLSKAQVDCATEATVAADLFMRRGDWENPNGVRADEDARQLRKLARAELQIVAAYDGLSDLERRRQSNQKDSSDLEHQQTNDVLRTQTRTKQEDADKEHKAASTELAAPFTLRAAVTARAHTSAAADTAKPAEARQLRAYRPTRSEAATVHSGGMDSGRSAEQIGSPFAAITRAERQAVSNVSAITEVLADTERAAAASFSLGQKRSPSAVVAVESLTGAGAETHSHAAILKKQLAAVMSVAQVEQVA